MLILVLLTSTEDQKMGVDHVKSAVAIIQIRTLKEIFDFSRQTFGQVVSRSYLFSDSTSKFYRITDAKYLSTLSLDFRNIKCPESSTSVFQWRRGLSGTWVDGH